MKITTLKATSLLLLAYAVIFVLDATVFTQQRGAVTFWDRVLVYVPMVLLLSWGLWRSKRWAWLGSIIFTAVFGVMGMLTLWAGASVSNSNYQSAHRWTTVDWAIVLVMNSIFITSFVLLLMPSSKQEVQKTS